MEEKELKAELAKEICFMSTAFASCEHLCSNAGKKVFIDWYLILKVIFFFLFSFVSVNSFYSYHLNYNFSLNDIL